ncbi:NB-ARC domain-containing protein [Streptomyces sp. NPDC055243]|uniref:NB-ARC domain-containing protein n=1 Tax=Streptomyces sp. NPDC055243 TaxID=3365720 RepID=UPI0037CF22F4
MTRLRGVAIGLTVAVAVSTALLALASNSATEDAHWPGILDALREHPWPAVAVMLTVATILLTTVSTRLSAVEEDPPAPGPAEIPNWVIGRSQTEQAIAAVCSSRRGAAGITAVLEGAGGFGKSTIADLVCANRRVQRRFRGRVFRVTVGRDVRGRAAISAKVGEVTRFITGNTEVFQDPEMAGAHLGRLLQKHSRTLLVLDDVWEAEQLRPFVIGGSNCVRLVTTRRPAILPGAGHRIVVDEMSPAQARQVLLRELPPLPPECVEELLRATGRWPLLLRLINRAVFAESSFVTDEGEPSRMTAAAAASQRILREMRAAGPTAVDDPWELIELDDPRHRAKAVRATIEAAAGLLPEHGGDRFAELSVFAADDAIPPALVEALWQRTAGLSSTASQALLGKITGLSLANPVQGATGSLALHDVVRDYLRAELGSERLTQTNETFLDACAALLPSDNSDPSDSAPSGRQWWQTGYGYIHDNILDHLLMAGRTTEAEATSGDLRWVESRLLQRGAAAAQNDCLRVPTEGSRQRARDIARIAHLLTPTNPAHAVVGILHDRLSHLPAWREQIVLRRAQGVNPVLVSSFELPDLPGSVSERALNGHKNWVHSLAFSPDGTRLATAGDDRSIRFWDPSSGMTMSSLRVKTLDRICDLAYSPDGAQLATVGTRVRLWNIATGKVAHTLPRRHTRKGRRVAYSPVGGQLATAGCDETVRIWDPATGASIGILTGHTDRVRAVAYSPDGAQIATAGYDETVRIWDPLTSASIGVLTGHTNKVRTVVYSPDGALIAAAGNQGVAWIWDVASRSLVHTLDGHTGAVSRVAFAPAGGQLATTGHDGKVQIWDLATGVISQTLTRHTGNLYAMAYSPDGRRLATAGKDGAVLLWDPNGSSDDSRSACVRALAVAPDGTQAALAFPGPNHALHVYELATDTLRAFAEHPDRVRTVAYAPVESHVATGCDDHIVRIWNQESGTLVRSLTGHTDWVNAVTYAPNGTQLASGGDDSMQLWDLATGSAKTRVRAKVLALAYSPDGSQLAVAVGFRILIIAPDSGKPKYRLRHPGKVKALAYSPDGTRLASGDKDGYVRVWDAVAPARPTCLLEIRGHNNHLSRVSDFVNSSVTVRALAYSPDGAYLATVSDDHSVRIWDQHGVSIAMTRTEQTLTSLAWIGGTSSRRLIGGGRAGAYIWDLL